MNAPESFLIVAHQSNIEAAGLSRRVSSGGIYQNQSWVSCKDGYVVVCDNKGCDTEIPVSWVSPAIED